MNIDYILLNRSFLRWFKSVKRWLYYTVNCLYLTF